MNSIGWELAASIRELREALEVSADWLLGRTGTRECFRVLEVRGW